MDAGEIAILALAAALAVLPPLVDRWALRHGASPQALIALASVTLAGSAAVPVAFVICASGQAAHEGATSAPGVAAVAGLLLVAIAAGRTLARVITIRRRWKALSHIAATLQPPAEYGGVQILPVAEPLAFAAGGDAYVSQGLLERLSPQEQLVVIAHEREHAQRRHGRLLALARALTHGSFDLPAVRHASTAIARELDTLADRAAAHRVGDPHTIRTALQTLAAHTAPTPTAQDETGLRHRLERLDARTTTAGRIVEDAVRLATLAIGAGTLAVICLSIHTRTIWLGAAACALLLASLYTFTRPTLTRRRPSRTTPQTPRRIPAETRTFAHPQTSAVPDARPAGLRTCAPRSRRRVS
ncbi:MAG TPA: M56 family metallopeptidase [Solirubrobacteraceae bacterium]|nr:M56 family metallopeptidase [Solirubrobacteraceae bacterium]